MIARGIERRKILLEEADRADVIGRLGAVAPHSDVQVLAWGLLPNLFRLLIRTGQVPLPRITRRRMTGYAVSLCTNVPPPVPGSPDCTVP